MIEPTIGFLDNICILQNARQQALFGVKRYDKGKADSGLQVGADPGNDQL
jgi:hypothetical protein